MFETSAGVSWYKNTTRHFSEGERFASTLVFLISSTSGAYKYSKESQETPREALVTIYSEFRQVWEDFWGRFVRFNKGVFVLTKKLTPFWNWPNNNETKRDATVQIKHFVSEPFKQLCWQTPKYLLTVRFYTIFGKSKANTWSVLKKIAKGLTELLF